MRTGIVVTARPGVEDLAVRAEQFGFSSFWVYDTPMVNGDPFVSLALCAKATERIKLGIGVTSPALRSAPAAAAAVASLNAIAPGRVICGVGTGNTARRTLGMLPTKMAELESFTASLQDLTAGRETEYTEGTRTRTVRFLHVGDYVNTEDPVEFVVAAFGLKAAEIAGRLGYRRDLVRFVGPERVDRVPPGACGGGTRFRADRPGRLLRHDLAARSRRRRGPPRRSGPRHHGPRRHGSADVRRRQSRVRRHAGTRRGRRRGGGCWNAVAPRPPTPTVTPPSTATTSAASNPRTATSSSHPLWTNWA